MLRPYGQLLLTLCLLTPASGVPAQSGGEVLFVVERLTGERAVRRGVPVPIKVDISEVPAPGIASLQGELAFDPTVLTVRAIELPLFPESGSIVATNTNLPGKARFAATLLGKETSGIRDGTLIVFRAECLRNGRSDLALTLEVLMDLEDAKLGYEITQGAIECKGGGQAPRASFSFSPTNPRPGEPVSFTDQSIDPDGGHIVKWEWDFGDGSKSGERNPKHTYLARGCYLVSLRVTDDDDPLSDQTTRRVSVGGGCPDVVVTNFPNPAKSEVTFDYEFLQPVKQASLKIFNLRGQLVFETQALTVTGTRNQLRWRLKDRAGKDLPNGPYFYLVLAVTQDNRAVRSPTNVLIIQR
jgi:hypothetical protein